jgi:uncharacterized protein DUF4383
VEAHAQPSASSFRTPVQELALLFGVGFIVLGVAGFIPGLTAHYSDLSFAGHGSRAKVFDVFQTSILQNLVHLLFGVAAIALARTRETARAFLVVGGLIYLVLFLYGIFTSDSSGANFIPVNGNDDVLHLALGVGMLGFGLIPERLPAGAGDTLAGFLAAAAIFVSATGVAYRPLRLIPLAILLALIAVGIGGRSERLATAAVFFGAACFAVGMAVAVVTSNPLW